MGLRLVKIKAKKIPQSDGAVGNTLLPYKVIPEKIIDYNQAMNIECDEEYFYVYYPIQEVGCDGKPAHIEKQIDITFLVKIKKFIDKIMKGLKIWG